jgi:hypothetical protein
MMVDPNRTKIRKMSAPVKLYIPGVERQFYESDAFYRSVGGGAVKRTSQIQNLR